MSAQKPTSKITIPGLQARKVTNGAAPIAMLTAYDAVTARTLANAGIEVLLVGDSVAMTLLGHDNTLSLTMEEMLHHVKAVSRGVQQVEVTPIVIADMPFLSYGVSVETGVLNAGRMIQEGGAQAVKLEGATPLVCETIQRCVSLGIPVMGHIGLTPQAVNQLGGFTVQGKAAHQARQLLQDALTLQQCGVFAIVLEMVPVEVAAEITAVLSIPTIGIGAGSQCDGQVLVIDDLLGKNMAFTPKFLRRYGDFESLTTQAAQQYKADLEQATFPSNKTEAFPLAEASRDTVLLAMRELLPDAMPKNKPFQAEATPCAN